MRPAIAWTLTLALSLAATGCQSTPRADAPRPAEAPAYAEIASRYNARVAPIDALWARASVRVEGRDAAGADLNDQGEGHLQIEPPARLALSLGKLGETHLYLGSSDDLYWWMELIDADDRPLTFGRHDSATPAKVGALGVPVHPLDLIDATAITPLPAAGGQVDWAEEGLLRVRTRARWGGRTMWLHPASLEPVMVVLDDGAGRVVLTAKLTRYSTAVKQGDASANVRVATRYEIRVPELDALVRIELFEPRIRPIREVAFDMETLSRAYRVTRREDLDAPRAAGPDG